MEITFKIILGDMQGKQYKLSEKGIYSFGRSGKCYFQITFNDMLISKSHFNIVIEQDIYIEDLNSLNGTYVNNIKCKKNQLLKKNDIIQVGKITLQVEILDNIKCEEQQQNVCANNHLIDINLVSQPGTSQNCVIEISNLSKYYRVLNRHEGLAGAMRDLFSRDYKYVQAVDGITMKITEGEIVGFLGPNGAGKSTAIKMMTGVLEPSNGSIKVNSIIPHQNRQQNAQSIGVVFGQRTQLWWTLPVIESFKILKDIYRIDNKTFQENLQLFESLVNISDLYSKPVRQMSLGQRTLCDILAACLHNPKIVFLDEPTIGLDVSIKSKIRALIRELNHRKKVTVILTTHDMGDVEALCKRVVIIDKGKVIYDDHFDNLKNLFGSYRTLKVIIENTDDGYKRFVSTLNHQFPNNNDLIISNEEEWINITINQALYSLTDILNFIMSSFIVKDIKIDEVQAESIIKKIYEGGVK